MRGRLLAGLALAFGGICLGAAGLVAADIVLAVIASACALVGSVLVASVAWVSIATRDAQKEIHAQAAGESTPDATVIDPVTELPNESYFSPAVDGRVAAARRHLWPVAIVLIELGLTDETILDEAATNNALSAFSDILKATLRESDVACRLEGNSFGLVLEDTSEEGGVWTAERIQIAVSKSEIGIGSMVAGIAAYPTHGLTTRDVLVRARAALARAAATPPGHGLGQVEVAHVDMS